MPYAGQSIRVLHDKRPNTANLLDLLPGVYPRDTQCSVPLPPAGADHRTEPCAPKVTTEQR